MHNHMLMDKHLRSRDCVVVSNCSLCSPSCHVYFVSFSTNFWHDAGDWYSDALYIHF